MAGRLFLNPSEGDLDDRVDSSDYFGFTSSHPKGPKVPGVVIYEPRKGTEPGRHSRFFKSYREAEREYGFSDVIRGLTEGQQTVRRWTVY